MNHLLIKNNDVLPSLFLALYSYIIFHLNFLREIQAVNLAQLTGRNYNFNGMQDKQIVVY